MVNISFASSDSTLVDICKWANASGTNLRNAYQFAKERDTVYYTMDSISSYYVHMYRHSCKTRNTKMIFKSVPDMHFSIFNNFFFLFPWSWIWHEVMYYKHDILLDKRNGKKIDIDVIRQSYSWGLIIPPQYGPSEKKVPESHFQYLNWKILFQVKQCNEISLENSCKDGTFFYYEINISRKIITFLRSEAF